MRIPKEAHESIRQNGEIVKKSQKHDANLRKNSMLYFQVGLIVCLLAAVGLLEMKFETSIPKYVEVDYSKDSMVDVPNIIPEEPKASEPIKPDTFKKPDDYVPVPDETPLNPFDPKIEEPTKDVNLPKDQKLVKLIPPPIDNEVDFIRVEHVPIYPGCENKKSNDERRKCMSDKITQLVQRKFNTNLGSELGLNGKQTIRTQFKIDKTGHVTDIKVRGTHPELEAEAQRVINFIPEMTPGKQRDKNVGVIYALPIVFEVQN